jgi:hypothetical protein
MDVKTQDVEAAPVTNSLKDRKKTQDQTQTEKKAGSLSINRIVIRLKSSFCNSTQLLNQTQLVQIYV